MPSCQSGVCTKRISGPPALLVSVVGSVGKASVGPGADKSVDLDRHVRQRLSYRGVVSAPYRTLLLLRPAKSAYTPGAADHDRPLAPRGVREAELAGDWLRAHAPAVDAVLCSTEIRTRETLAGEP